MPSRRNARTRRKAPELDPVSARLEFLIGLSLLPPDATEPDKVALARRVGLDAAAVARMFNKTAGAAQKALERALKA
jgi:hypothetical protein